MKFLSNIYDPSKEDAPQYHTYSFHAHMNGQEAMKQEWERHLEWVNSNIVGPPQGTDYYNVEELEARGIVGIYSTK